VSPTLLGQLGKEEPQWEGVVSECADSPRIGSGNTIGIKRKRSPTGLIGSQTTAARIDYWW
jgi:hypothetical protein